MKSRPGKSNLVLLAVVVMLGTMILSTSASSHGSPNGSSSESQLLFWHEFSGGGAWIMQLSLPPGNTVDVTMHATVVTGSGMGRPDETPASFFLAVVNGTSVLGHTGATLAHFHGQQAFVTAEDTNFEVETHEQGPAVAGTGRLRVSLSQQTHAWIIVGVEAPYATASINLTDASSALLIDQELVGLEGILSLAKIDFEHGVAGGVYFGPAVAFDLTTQVEEPNGLVGWFDSFGIEAKARCSSPSNAQSCHFYDDGAKSLIYEHSTGQWTFHLEREFSDQEAGLHHVFAVRLP